MPKGVPNKRYTPEFKRMVVETMKKEHLSIYAAMQEFGINDHKIYRALGTHLFGRRAGRLVG